LFGAPSTILARCSVHQLFGAPNAMVASCLARRAPSGSLVRRTPSSHHDPPILARALSSRPAQTLRRLPPNVTRG
jgi:hypothetical protein